MRFQGGGGVGVCFILHLPPPPPSSAPLTQAVVTCFLLTQVRSGSFPFLPCTPCSFPKGRHAGHLALFTGTVRTIPSNKTGTLLFPSLTELSTFPSLPKMCKNKDRELSLFFSTVPWRRQQWQHQCGAVLQTVLPLNPDILQTAPVPGLF